MQTVSEKIRYFFELRKQAKEEVEKIAVVFEGELNTKKAKPKVSLFLLQHQDELGKKFCS